MLSEKKLSEENLSIARRFVEVFDFAYTRFLDITKAEAQAREAQIETALERVRARTMAMQKSNELARTAAHLFEQLSSLGIKPYRCNIAIVNREFKNCKIWSTTNSGNVIPTASALPLDEYPELIEMYDGWKTQKPKYKFKLVGTERLEWTKYISKYLPFEEYKKNNMNEAELLKEAAYFTNLYFRQGFFTIHSKDELTDDQIKIIQRFAYVFEQTYTRFLDLENSEIQNKIIQAENERKTEELEEARQLQLAMLPKELPQLPNLDIAVYMKTATEVGGDYYDFNIGTDGELTAVIGDATGHGMKAGTIVTITKSMFNSLASEKNILKVFSQISQVIRDMKFRQLSMCLMMLKIIDNNLSISSAAMPPAFIYIKDENRAHEIVINGMPLGALPSFPYKIEEIILNPGDTILLMSDGYPELINDKGNMFGYEKALKLFEELAHKPSEKIIEGLKNSASEWVQNKMPDDDVTFVVIKVK
ncbi:MAG: SpoIIE family protein phosphatase [Ignavibacteriales bacterium]|nr:SpoIIE family protein phosphatase [Ignavibacteriales bacterium]